MLSNTNSNKNFNTSKYFNDTERIKEIGKMDIFFMETPFFCRNGKILTYIKVKIMSDTKKF